MQEYGVLHECSHPYAVHPRPPHLTSESDLTNVEQNVQKGHMSVVVSCQKKKKEAAFIFHIYFTLQFKSFLGIARKLGSEPRSANRGKPGGARA